MKNRDDLERRITALESQIQLLMKVIAERPYPSFPAPPPIPWWRLPDIYPVIVTTDKTT